MNHLFIFPTSKIISLITLPAHACKKSGKDENRLVAKRLGDLSDLHREIDADLTRIPYVLAEVALDFVRSDITNSDLADMEIARIEEQLAAEELSLQEAVRTLRISGLLRD